MDKTASFQSHELGSQPEVFPRKSTVNQPIQTSQADLPPSPPSKDKKSSFPIMTLIKIGIGLTVVILLIVFIFSFVLPAININKAGKVTLTYWGLWEDSKIMQGIISDFERDNPNISIDYSKQDIKQYRERLSTRIANGTGPDIFRFHNTWLPMMSGLLLPLPSDVVSKSDFASSYYPVSQKDLIKNGAIYGIPIEIDTLALFINTQLFQSAGLTPPKDWNEFTNDAVSLTVKDSEGKIKTAGTAMGTFDNITHAPDIISLLFAQNGVKINDISSDPQKAANALNFYNSFANQGGNNNVWDNTLDPSILAFSKGNLAMYFGYSWDYFTIKTFDPNLNVQIVSVPQLPDQNKSIASYWAEGISIKGKHQKQAMLFLKFLTKKETEEKLYAEEAKTRAFGEPYARIDLSDKLSSDPIVYPFVSQAKYATSSFFADSTFDGGLNQQMNTYLGNAINSMLKGSSAESAYDTLSKGVSQVLGQYGM